MTQTLHGPHKSAILLQSLDPQQAAEILARLAPDAAKLVRREMAVLREVPEDERLAVLSECKHELVAPGAAREEGSDPLGDFSADELMEILHDEHPQLIAAVVSTLPAEKCGECINALPVQRQIDVFCRVESIRPLAPVIRAELMRHVEARRPHRAAETPADAHLLARVLEEARDPIARDSARGPSDAAPASAPPHFVFEDLLELEDAPLRSILEEVDAVDLSLALRTAGREIRRRVLRILPQTTARIVKASSDALGPVQLSAIESAQAKILRILHRLEAAGEVRIRRMAGRM